MHKIILILALFFITFMSTNIIVEKNKEIYSKDSIINYNREVFLRDSSLIRDLAVMSSEGKYDQMAMIFEMNKRNIKSYK